MWKATTGNDSALSFGDAQCEFFVTDDNGSVKTEGVDILYSLRQRNWDAIGNTWRPNYELSEERIAALQQAAHEAVANMNN